MAMRPFHKVYDGISGEPGFPILEPGLFFCLYNQEASPKTGTFYPEIPP